MKSSFFSKVWYGRLLHCPSVTSNTRGSLRSPPAAQPAARRAVSALMVLLAFSLCRAYSIGSCKLLQSNVLCCGSCSCFQVQGLILSCLSYTEQLKVPCSEPPDLSPASLPYSPCSSWQSEQFHPCWSLAGHVPLCLLTTCRDTGK